MIQEQLANTNIDIDDKGGHLRTRAKCDDVSVR